MYHNYLLILFLKDIMNNCFFLLQIIKALDFAKIINPTPIQNKIIPLIINKTDVLGSPNWYRKNYNIYCQFYII